MSCNNDHVCKLSCVAAGAIAGAALAYCALKGCCASSAAQKKPQGAEALRAALKSAEADAARLEDELVAEVRKTKPAPLVDAIVMSGPSGVGKGTIIDRLMKDRPGQFSFCVSHTSRAPRAGEVDGKNYHFSTKEAMKAMVERNEFLECCDVHGNMYGTSVAALRDVQKTGAMPIIEIDVQGAQKLKAAQGDKLRLCFMFIEAPSMEELESRIVGRGQESGDKVQVRLSTARKEMAFVSGNRHFFDNVLTNVDLERSLAEIQRYFAIRCGV
jgi:guanylate kinase